MPERRNRAISESAARQCWAAKTTVLTPCTHGGLAAGKQVVHVGVCAGWNPDGWSPASFRGWFVNSVIWLPTSYGQRVGTNGQESYLLLALSPICLPASGRYSWLPHQLTNGGWRLQETACDRLNPPSIKRPFQDKLTSCGLWSPHRTQGRGFLHGWVTGGYEAMKRTGKLLVLQCHRHPFLPRRRTTSSAALGGGSSPRPPGACCNAVPLPDPEKGRCGAEARNDQCQPPEETPRACKSTQRPGQGRSGAYPAGQLAGGLSGRP